MDAIVDFSSRCPGLRWSRPDKFIKECTSYNFGQIRNEMNKGNV